MENSVNQEKKLQTSICSNKKFIVTASLSNHNWNGGEHRMKQKCILAKNKTSAIAKFIKLHRSYIDTFDVVDVECKLEC